MKYLYLISAVLLLCSFKPTPSHIKAANKILSKEYPKKSIQLTESESEGVYKLVIDNGDTAKVYFRELTPKVETFYYFVAIAKNGTILKFHILDYPSQYGYQVASPKWGKKLIGKYPANIEVDAISGGTLTVSSLIRDLKTL